MHINCCNYTDDGSIKETNGNDVTFMWLLNNINHILDKFHLNTAHSDIFERSILKMFGIEEIAGEDCSFYSSGSDVGNKGYVFIKLDLPACFAKLLVTNINNITSDAAKLVDSENSKILLSYMFIYKNFFPNFRNFLCDSPWFVVSMQEKYKTLISPADKFYDYHYSEYPENLCKCIYCNDEKKESSKQQSALAGDDIDNCCAIDSSVAEQPKLNTIKRMKYTI